MAIDRTTGWTRSKDANEVATQTSKLKLTGLTLDEGDMLQLQDNTNLETLELSGCTVQYAAGAFDINDLPVVQSAATLTLLDLTDCVGIQGAPSIDWQDAENLADINISGCTYSDTELDAFLIGVAAAVAGTPGLGSATTPGTIDVTVADAVVRTTASDAAVTALGAAGFTVTENP